MAKYSSVSCCSRMIIYHWPMFALDISTLPQFLSANFLPFFLEFLLQNKQREKKVYSQSSTNGKQTLIVIMPTKKGKRIASGKVELFIMPFSLGERDFPLHILTHMSFSRTLLCDLYGTRYSYSFPSPFFCREPSILGYGRYHFLLLSVGARVKGQQFYFANIVCCVSNRFGDFILGNIK